MSSEHDKNEKDLFESVTICSKTVECFLRELDETHERWGDAKWVFRGQNDARWELQPSLFRVWDDKKPISYELDLIDSFIQFSNVVKLDIPYNSLDYVSLTGRKSTLRSFVPGVSYDFSHVVFAIAQHYGVPTRLLDFSHSPLVAAYFSADHTDLLSGLGWSIQAQANYLNRCIESLNDFGTVRQILGECAVQVSGVKKCLPKKIAVWAIDTFKLETETSLKLLAHPYGQIRYLREQMGVFCARRSSKMGKEKWAVVGSRLTKNCRN